MLTENHKSRNIVANLKKDDVQRIKDFVQGSVYCFCKNCPDRYFAARDLFGGKNFHWQETPLMKLFEWHLNNRKADAKEMAGKDIGWILLDVIKEDKREFDLNDDYVHEYKWTGIGI